MPPGSEPRGIILLGDSAGAHFHVPPEWITASRMSWVSGFGSHHPRARRPLCSFLLALPLSLSVVPAPNRCKCPLLSKICRKRHIRSQLSSVQFKQCDKQCQGIAATGTHQEPSPPIREGRQWPWRWWQGDWGTCLLHSCF